jgi:hypothetical protein
MQQHRVAFSMSEDARLSRQLSARPHLGVNFRNGPANQLPGGVAQMPPAVSSAEQDSQRGFGSDDHGATPVIS